LTYRSEMQKIISVPLPRAFTGNHNEDCFSLFPSVAALASHARMPHDFACNTIHSGFACRTCRNFRYGSSGSGSMERC
jgi:hypothetical protein